MAIRREMSIDTTQAFAPGAAFSQELGPLPITVTRMDLLLEANFTTSATPGTTQDYLWRALSSLQLASSLGAHLSMQDLRVLHFENVALWGDRVVTPAAPGASAANAIKRALLRIDFGVNSADPHDLTAGIPQGVGSLALSGTWGALASIGAGYTVNSLTLRTTLYGMQEEYRGDPSARPRAIPVFQTVRLQPTAGTGSLGYQYNLPKGHFLHSATVMAAAGAAPADNRSDAAISDVGLLVPVAGNATRMRMTWHQTKQQSKASGVADDDGSTFGVPTVSSEGNVGVAHLPLVRLLPTNKSPDEALYGLDLRGAGEGDVQLAYGIANATNLSIWQLLRQYDLAPAAVA